MTKIFYQRGQVTMIGAVVVAAITVLGGFFTAKITADSTVNDRIADVRTNAAVTSAKVDIVEKNTGDRLDRLESKIDWLIRNQGGTPQTVTITSSLAK